MNEEQAIIIVARRALAYLVERYLDDDWDEFAEIGEQDWDRICGVANTLAAEPSDADYDAAYKLLAARAEKHEEPKPEEGKPLPPDYWETAK